MNETWLGRQPVADLLMERGITVAEAAQRIGVDRQKLIGALVGLFPPTRRVVVGLMKLLDLPPRELFTEKSLRKGAEKARKAGAR